MTDPRAWTVDPLPGVSASLVAQAESILAVRRALDGDVGGRLWGGPSGWLGAAARAGEASLEGILGELSTVASGLLAVASCTDAARAQLSMPLEALRADIQVAETLARSLSVDPTGIASLLLAAATGRHLEASVAAVLAADAWAAQALDDVAVSAHVLLRQWNTEALRELLSADGVAPGVPPPDTAPETVADWWASRTEAERNQFLFTSPAVLGCLDGLPAAARDVANRLSLSHFISSYDDSRRLVIAQLRAAVATVDIPGLRAGLQALHDLERRARFVATIEETISAYAGRLDQTGRPVDVQLLLADPDAFDGIGRAAVVFGDLDTAANVAYVVPGFRQRVVPELPNTVSDAWRLHDAEPGAGQLATVTWLGYDVPMGVDVAFAGDANSGAQRLRGALRGLRANRRSRGEPHLTVVAHSYGSTLAGALLRDDTGTGVDDLVVLGSPGVGVESAAELHVPPGHVWVGAASGDPVGRLAQFGADPAAERFGAQRFVAETPRGDRWHPFEQHSHYFDAGTPSLANIAAVVTGRPADVELTARRQPAVELPLRWPRVPPPIPLPIPLPFPLPFGALPFGAHRAA